MSKKDEDILYILDDVVYKSRNKVLAAQKWREGIIYTVNKKDLHALNTMSEIEDTLPFLITKLKLDTFNHVKTNVSFSKKEIKLVLNRFYLKPNTSEVQDIFNEIQKRIDNSFFRDYLVLSQDEYAIHVKIKKGISQDDKDALVSLMRMS